MVSRKATAIGMISVVEELVTSLAPAADASGVVERGVTTDDDTDTPVTTAPHVSPVRVTVALPHVSTDLAVDTGAVPHTSVFLVGNCQIQQIQYTILP